MITRTARAIPLSLLLFSENALAADAVDYAASLIGRPYEWGAEGPDSFDCSGLTQYVFQAFGIELPRRAISQSKVGDRAGRRLQRGDLVFFSTEPRGSVVTHVGIYEGGGMMIDASKRHGRVRRDDLDDEYWVDRFLFARRIDGEMQARNERGESDDPVITREPRSSDRRRAAIRILGRIAEEFLRRPR